MASVLSAASRSSAAPVRATCSSKCGGTMKQQHPDIRLLLFGPPRPSVDVYGVPQLLEETFGDLLWLTGQTADLPQQRFLLGGQILGHHHLYGHQLIPAPSRSRAGHPLALQAERLSVLRASRNRNLCRPLEGRYFDGIADGR